MSVVLVAISTDALRYVARIDSTYYYVDVNDRKMISSSKAKYIIGAVPMSMSDDDPFESWDDLEQAISRMGHPSEEAFKPQDYWMAVMEQCRKLLARDTREALNEALILLDRLFTNPWLKVNAIAFAETYRLYDEVERKIS